MIKKEIKPGDILGLFTIGGTELICKVCEETGTELVVSDFRVLGVDSKGSATLIVPLQSRREGTPIRIQKSSLTAIFEPHEDIATGYKEVMSGIALPPENKSLILPR